jgi:hypothetical protein
MAELSSIKRSHHVGALDKVEHNIKNAWVEPAPCMRSMRLEAGREEGQQRLHRVVERRKELRHEWCGDDLSHSPWMQVPLHSTA